ASLTITADRTLGSSAKLGGAGTFVMGGGTTVVPDNATLNPAVLTLNGGVLNLNGTAPATTLAQVNLTGGTLGGTRPRPITNLAAQSGTLTGAQITTVTGSLVKSTASQVIVSGGTTIRPTIDTSWNAGDICIQGGSTLKIEHALNVAAGGGTFNCSDT